MVAEPFVKKWLGTELWDPPKTQLILVWDTVTRTGSEGPRGRCRVM